MPTTVEKNCTFFDLYVDIVGCFVEFTFYHFIMW